MAIEFTVDHDHTYAGEEGIEQLIGWVTFSVSTYPGDFRVREQGAGVARTMNIPSRRGWLATDGHLYKDQTLEQPCRLVANDPTFNLKHLTYRADFELTTVLGDPVAVPLAYFPAPGTDTTLYLTKVMMDPSQPVMEVRAKAYAEDILDAGTAGIGMLQSETTDDAWSTLGAGNAGLEVLYADTVAAARSAIGVMTGVRPAIIGSKIRGGNITVKTGYDWNHFWSDWDWDNWVKPQVDRAIKLGLNAIRLIGTTRATLGTTVTWYPRTASTPYDADYLVTSDGRVYQCLTSGTTSSGAGPTGTGSSITDGSVVWKYVRQDDLSPITQAQYDAQWAQLVEYCGNNGLSVYPCLCTYPDFDTYSPGDYQDATVTASILTTAAKLSEYPNVIAFDLFQEGDIRSGVPWAPDTVNAAGAYSYVRNDGNKSYLCITSGTSASSGGPTGTGSSITDGTVVWKYTCVPLAVADVLLLMAKVRSVSNVPLTMSAGGYAPSNGFWVGAELIGKAVNSDPAGVDFVDVHVYDERITPDKFATYAAMFDKPVLIGEYGARQDVTSDQQVGRMVAAQRIHAMPNVIGSLVWALSDQGENAPARLCGVWDNTGFVQGNSVNTAAPLSTSLGERSTLTAEVRQFAVSDRPAWAECATAQGGTGAEDGANTWAKILTVSPGSFTFDDIAVLLDVSTAGNTGVPDSAIVTAMFHVGNTGADPTVSVHLLANGGSGTMILPTSFKIVSGGFGTDMELWVQKAATYGKLTVNELGRSSGGGNLSLIYAPSPSPWQSATPTGSVNNVTSTGVNALNRFSEINDVNGKTAVGIVAVSNAVNHVTITDSAAGVSPQIAVGGTDTTLDLNIAAIGAGSVKLRGDSGQVFAANAVSGSGANFITAQNATTGNPAKIGASGTDTDVSLNLTTQNAGTVQINGAAALYSGGALGTPSSGTLANCTFPTLNQNTTGSAATLTTARTIDGVSFNGSAAVVTYPARLLAPAAYTSGQYYFCNSTQGGTAAAGLGVGTVRVTAWLVTQQFTLSSLFCEYTVAGESGSKFRIGIWSDDGTGQPGAVFLDAGQVATDGTPGNAEITGLSTVVPPGLYWVGGAVQSVVTTQPTMRLCSATSTPFPNGPLGSTIPSTNYTSYGFGKGGQTGAFSTISTPSLVASAVRIGFKVT